FTEEASRALRGYDWPGNVRELRNAVERAVLLCHDEYLGLQYLPLKLTPVEASSPGIGDPVSLEAVEEMHIRRILASAKSIEDACRILGMDSVTLWRRRKKYGI
ncbi:MAG: sigma-54-dependent Fis family transcriptional regulator, partial [Deltaproteobacteria bacterium]|nr:sigma-54-dependent Fis family transcriptional regulator [Deltaproteobacteria bacterium]